MDLIVESRTQIDAARVQQELQQLESELHHRELQVVLRVLRLCMGGPAVGLMLERALSRWRMAIREEHTAYALREAYKFSELVQTATAQLGEPEAREREMRECNGELALLDAELKERERELHAAELQALSKALEQAISPEPLFTAGMQRAFSLWQLLACMQRGAQNMWYTPAQSNPCRRDLMLWGLKATRGLSRVIGPLRERGVALSRALGLWQSAICCFEARDLRKALQLANERARNLKKGWQQEREERRALSERVLHLQEADGRAASEQAALLAERERLAHIVSQREPLTARVRDLEAQLTSAKEDCARARDAAKVDRKALQALRLDRSNAQAQATSEAVREQRRAVQDAQAKMQKANDSVVLHRQMLARVALQAMAARLASRDADGLHLSNTALRLSVPRLRKQLAQAESSRVGERWRAARCSVRFLRAMRLSAIMHKWTAAAREMALRDVMLTEHNDVAALIDASQDRLAKHARQLQAKFEVELKKERALAVSRLQERDALDRQLREAQAQLKARKQPRPEVLRKTATDSPETGRKATPAPARVGRSTATSLPGTINRGRTNMEVEQLRSSLASMQHERDVLLCEVSALQTELEASRELLG